MKKQNQLFRIISTLQAPEKSYIKKFGYKQDNHDSSLESLFNLADKALRSSKEVDESKLIEQFAKKHPELNYTKTKSRLLAHVLDGLRSYDKKRNETEKVFDLLAIAESLRKRDLFFDAWNILQKAEKLAEALELTELVIHIKSKKYYYEIFTQKYQASELRNATLDHLVDDLETLRNRITSDFAAYRILHFQKSIGIPRSEEDIQLLKEIKALPAFQDDFESQLGGARLNLAVAMCGIYFSLGDIPSVIKVAQKLLHNYAVSDQLRKLNSAKYLSLFDSFLQAALLSLNVSLFEEYYPQFQHSPTFGQDDKNLKHGIDLYLRSIYAIVAKKLEGVPQLIEEFNLVREKAYIPNYRKVSLGYYMSFAPFLRADYSQAMAQIQWMKNNHHLGMRYDIEVGILGMECMILLERKDFDLLAYRLRAFDEFVRKKGRKFKLEAAMIRFIRAALSSQNQSAFQEICKDSHAEMTAIIQDNPQETAFLQAFDVMSWLESRSMDLDFAEVYFKNNIP